MKNFFTRILIGIITCAIASLLLPWWWIFIVITFLLSLILPYSTAARSFWGGLMIVFISWAGLYLFLDQANDSLMSAKIANLFSLKNNLWLFFIASVIMGLIGGSGSLSAYFLRKK